MSTKCYSVLTKLPLTARNKKASSRDFLVHRLLMQMMEKVSRRSAAEKGVRRGEGYDQAVFLQDSSGDSRWDRLRVGAPSVNS